MIDKTVINFYSQIGKNETFPSLNGYKTMDKISFSNLNIKKCLHSLLF